METDLRRCPFCREKTANRQCNIHGIATIGPEVFRGPREPIQTGHTICGRYKVGRCIGQGASGTVYEAVDEKGQKEIALKLLSHPPASMDKAILRFFREAIIARRLVHPNIAAVYDVGVDLHSRTAFMAQTLARGPSLAQYVEECGPVSLCQAWAWIADIAKGLSHAHHQGIVHRDLKPGNVMITDRDQNQTHRPGGTAGHPGPGNNIGLAQIVDFGLAQIADGSDDRAELTVPGELLGTPHFASPEQCLGQAVNTRTDLYSLGCILYAMLVGRPPFAGTPQAVVRQHQCERPPNLPLDASQEPKAEATQALYQSLMAKAPAARPSDASNVARFTEALLRNQTPDISLLRGQSPEAPGLMATTHQALPPAPRRASLPVYPAVKRRGRTQDRD